MIRIYGVERGNGSWARVSRGVIRGLERFEKFAGFYQLSEADLSYEDDRMTEGFDAPCGICVGPPLAASAMTGRGRHERNLLMIATNSSWLPETVMDQSCRLVTGFIATSSWAAEVVEKYAQGLPVYVWPHGVDPGFVDHPTDPDGEFTVLHLASTHLQRKGTEQLIHAWAAAMREGQIPLRSELRLVMDGPRGYHFETVHHASGGCAEIAESFRFYPRLDLSVADLSVFYSRAHAVCQPSRAEGFGLVPLEARACGVPVLSTACTGHSEHVQDHTEGLVVIPHGPDEPIDDGPGAYAPSVSAADIQEKLSLAYDQRDDLRKRARAVAAAVRQQWSWEAVTSRFLLRYADELGVA